MEHETREGRHPSVPSQRSSRGASSPQLAHSKTGERCFEIRHRSPSERASEGAREVRPELVLEEGARLVNQMLRDENRHHRNDNYQSRNQRGFEIQKFNAAEEMAKTDHRLMKFFLDLSLNDTGW